MDKLNCPNVYEATRDLTYTHRDGTVETYCPKGELVYLKRGEGYATKVLDNVLRGAVRGPNYKVDAVRAVHFPPTELVGTQRPMDVGVYRVCADSTMTLMESGAMPDAVAASHEPAPLPLEVTDPESDTMTLDGPFAE